MSDPTLELTQALVARPSVTPDDAGCQRVLAERLAACGFRIEHMRFGAVENLWARRGGQPPLLVFAGHTDVVPAGPRDAWLHDPFQGVIADQHLYGRGTADMKASLAAFVTAIERFTAKHPEHRGSIGLLITSDEEGPAVDGTARVVEVLTGRGEHIDYCIVGEPSSEHTTGDVIKVGRRGSLNGILRVFGVQGHVAYPQHAENPIHNFAPALVELTNTVWDRGNAHFPPTTFQVSNIEAGTGASNVIPGVLSVRFNFRFSTESSPATLKARVEDILQRCRLQFELDWEISGIPFLTPDGQLVTVVQRAISSELGVQPRLSTAGGTSDGRFIAPTGAEVIEFGPVNQTIHRANECIPIHDPERLSRVYGRILELLLTEE